MTSVGLHFTVIHDWCVSVNQCPIFPAFLTVSFWIIASGVTVGQIVFACVATFIAVLLKKKTRRGNFHSWLILCPILMCLFLLKQNALWLLYVTYTDTCLISANIYYLKVWNPSVTQGLWEQQIKYHKYQPMTLMVRQFDKYPFSTCLFNNSLEDKSMCLCVSINFPPSVY